MKHLVLDALALEVRPMCVKSLVNQRNFLRFPTLPTGFERYSKESHIFRQNCLSGLCFSRFGANLAQDTPESSNCKSFIELAILTDLLLAMKTNMKSIWLRVFSPGLKIFFLTLIKNLKPYLFAASTLSFK